MTLLKVIFFSVFVLHSQPLDKGMIPITESALIAAIQKIPLSSPEQGKLITRASVSHLENVAYKQYYNLWKNDPNNYFTNIDLGGAAEEYWHIMMTPKAGAPVGTPETPEVGKVAIQCFSKAIALDPNSAIAYAELGSIMYFQGYGQQGLLYLNKAIKMAPNNAHVLDLIAYIQSLPNPPDYKPKIAEQELEKAIRLAPTESYAYWALAQLYTYENEYPKAEKEFKLYLSMLTPAVAQQEYVKDMQGIINKGLKGS